MTDKLVLLNPHNGRRGVPEAFQVVVGALIAAGEHKIIGEGRDFADVEQENVLRLLLGGRFDYLARQLVGFQTPSSSFRFVFPRRITL